MFCSDNIKESVIFGFYLQPFFFSPLPIQTITCRRGLEKVKKLSDYHRFVDTEELEEAAAGEIGRFLTEDAGLGDAGRDAEYVVVDKEGLKKRVRADETLQWSSFPSQENMSILKCYLH